MKNLLLYILLALLVVIGGMYIIGLFQKLVLAHYLTVFGYFFVTVSAILVYTQIRINLRYNKRKEAFNFSFDKIEKELFPLLKHVKELLKKDFLIFTKEASMLELLKQDTLNEEEKKDLIKTVLSILNFYERMSIGILKQVIDEDICYDDNGFNLIQFYNWVKPYIVDLQIKHDEERIFINFLHIADKWEKYYIRTKSVNTALNKNLWKQRTVRDKSI